MEISCGLPQGSLIAPILFIIYINDIHNISETLTKILFADDTNLFKAGKCLTNLSKDVENELIEFETWLKINKLSLNVGKTKTMVFTSSRNISNKNVNISMSGNILEQVKSTKFLGINIDHKLDWREHINYVCNKLAKINGMLYKSRDYLNIEARIQLYNSFVLPHLTYCIAVWGGAHKTYLTPLITLQKRIIRTIHYGKTRDHTSPLFKKQNSLKFEDLYKLEILKIIHQLENNDIPENLQEYNIKHLNIHTYDTRNKTNFVIPNYALKSIIGAGKKLWNNLEKSIKLTENRKKFSDMIKSKYITNY